MSLNVKGSDAHSTKLLRVAIGKMSCKLGMESCWKQVQEQQTKLEISPDVRAIVLCSSVENMNILEPILEEALETDSFIRKDLLSSLICASESDLDG